MLVLIVEDNAFNAFCMSRILEATLPGVDVRMAGNSRDARTMLDQDGYDLLIVDGDLGASDGLCCNGPALVDTLWRDSPSFNIVAWSDSAAMRRAFATVFQRHNKPFNDLFSWPKMIGPQRVRAFLQNCFPIMMQKTPEHNLYDQ